MIPFSLRERARPGLEEKTETEDGKPETEKKSNR